MVAIMVGNPDNPRGASVTVTPQQTLKDGEVQ